MAHLSNEELLAMLSGKPQASMPPSASPSSPARPSPLISGNVLPKRASASTQAASRKPARTHRSAGGNLVPIILALAGIVVLANLSPDLGNAPKVTGEALSDPATLAQPQRVTVHVRFVRTQPAQHQVTWKCLTIDGYPVTLVLDQGLTPPQIQPGQPLKVIATPISDSVLSVRSAQDLTLLASLADTRTYVGTFTVTEGVGRGKLYDGQTFMFHAPGFDDGTYNYLEVATDERGEALATDLDVLENPRELLITDG